MSILDKLTSAQKANMDPETLATIDRQARLYNWINYTPPADVKDEAPRMPDFSTLRGKLDFIREHGEEAYLVALTKWRDSGATSALARNSLNFM